MQQILLGSGLQPPERRYIDDAFSTYIWKGNSSTRSIVTGLDMSGDGGLVWIKRRTAPDEEHLLFDTDRGAGKKLSTETTAQSTTVSSRLTAFNNNGFTLGSDGGVNNSSYEYSSWSFKQTPGFFDMVSYTGNGSAGRSISHSLGCKPRLVIIKRTNGTEGWAVYFHTGSGDGGGTLNEANALLSGGVAFGTNSTTFTVYTEVDDVEVNESGHQYIAYLFGGGQNAEDNKFGAEDQNVIKVGKVTTDGNGDAFVDCGWEPQWSFARSFGANQWFIGDVMRGLSNEISGSTYDRHLWANSDNSEMSYDIGNPTPTGMQYRALGANTDYLYMLIRRPDGKVGKPVTAGTNVLTMTAGSSGAPLYKSPNHLVDFTLQKSSYQSGTANWTITSRLTFGQRLESNTTIAESANQYQVGDYQDGWSSYDSGDGSRFAWLFKRHAGLDVVTYKGLGASSAPRTFTHSLGQAPEMIWTKNRSSAVDWVVWHKDLNGGSSAAAPYNLRLNQDDAQSSNGDIYGGSGNVLPTTTSWTTGGNNMINENGSHFLAILFASVSGISKCGSYSGSSGSVTVTCGFQPRLIIIKRINATEDWLIFDTVRGIASGNDARLRINRDGAEASSSDWVDLDSDGFTVNEPGDSSINGSGNSFIYYAHA